MVWGFFWVHLPARGPLLASPWLGTEGTSPAVPPPGCPPLSIPSSPEFFRPPPSKEDTNQQRGPRPCCQQNPKSPRLPGAARGALSARPLSILLLAGLLREKSCPVSIRPRSPRPRPGGLGCGPSSAARRRLQSPGKVEGKAASGPRGGEAAKSSWGAKIGEEKAESGTDLG